MPAPDPAPSSAPYAAWKYPDFRFYSASWFLLTFAKAIETVAVGYTLYDRTADYMALGWMGLVQALPVILLAVAGGHLADRFPRRNVLIFTLALSVVGGVILLVNALHSGPIGMMYLALGTSAVGRALGSPARSALLPQLVPGPIYSNAITWISTLFRLSAMTGPALAGVILIYYGQVTAFWLIVICRSFSLAAVFLIRNPVQTEMPEPLSWKSVLAGIRFVRQTKLILAIITLDLFAVLFGGAVYLLPVFAKDILHRGELGLGLLLSSEAVGAVVMALMIAHLPILRQSGRALFWAVIGFGAYTMILGVSEIFWISMAAMFFIGALDNISVVVRHSVVQLLTPDPMRGRVSAVNNIFIVASNDIGGFESGLTAWLFGPVISVVGGGIGTILVVLGVFKIWPEVGALGSLENLQPAEMAQAQKTADEETAERG
ncbi:MAG: MFS transporter [Pirellulales bacterium]|nr:MFS transporter [Pirellulales bacterium]